MVSRLFFDSTYMWFMTTQWIQSLSYHWLGHSWVHFRHFRHFRTINNQLKTRLFYDCFMIKSFFPRLKENWFQWKNEKVINEWNGSWFNDRKMSNNRMNAHVVNNTLIQKYIDFNPTVDQLLNGLHSLTIV